MAVLLLAHHEHPARLRPRADFLYFWTALSAATVRRSQLMGSAVTEATRPDDHEVVWLHTGHHTFSKSPVPESPDTSTRRVSENVPPETSGSSDHNHRISANRCSAGCQGRSAPENVTLSAFPSQLRVNYKRLASLFHRGRKGFPGTTGELAARHYWAYSKG